MTLFTYFCSRVVLPLQFQVVVNSFDHLQPTISDFYNVLFSIVYISITTVELKPRVCLAAPCLAMVTGLHQPAIPAFWEAHRAMVSFHRCCDSTPKRPLIPFSLRQAVVLPEGEDLNEWVAVHVVDFYNQLNMLYGTITEFCSPKSCPRMIATEEYEYLWQDSNNPRYKKPTKMSAPEYCENLMNWVQGFMDDENIFPSQSGVPFSKYSPQVFKNILKRLFRVYAHISAIISIKLRNWGCSRTLTHL